MALLGLFFRRLTTAFAPPLRLCCRMVLPSLYALALGVCVLRTGDKHHDYLTIIASGVVPLLLGMFGQTVLPSILFPFPSIDEGKAAPAGWRARHVASLALVTMCSLAMPEVRLSMGLKHACMHEALAPYVGVAAGGSPLDSNATLP